MNTADRSLLAAVATFKRQVQNADEMVPPEVLEALRCVEQWATTANAQLEQPPPASSRAKAPARSPRPAPNRRGRPTRAGAIPKVNSPHVARALEAAGLTTAKQRSIAFKTLALLRSQYVATKQGKVINRKSVAAAAGASLRLAHDVLRRMVDVQLITEPLRIPGRGNAAPSIINLGLTFLDPMAKPPEHVLQRQPLEVEQ